MYVTDPELLETARDGVVAVESTRRCVTITGADRLRWLNGVVTCDLAKLRAGVAMYGLLTEKKGKILTDLVAVERVDRLTLALPAETREATLAVLDHYIVMEDVEVEMSDEAVYLLYGPRAADVAAAAGQGGASRGGALSWGPIAGAATFTSDPKAARDAMLAAGARVTTEDAWEGVRVVLGLPRFGKDFDSSFYPQEAALEKIAISFDKGCYVGQEVIYMLENRGHVQRKLVRLESSGSSAFEPGTEIANAASARVGEVRSSTRLGEDTVMSIALVAFAVAKGEQPVYIEGVPAHVRSETYRPL